MKRALKYLAIAGLILVLLLGAGLIALRILYPPQKLQALALEKLQAALGREVRIASASLGLRGVVLKGLEISEAHDFKAGTFLKADQFRVRVHLAPLILERKLSIAEIFLSGWDIRIVKFADGALNASALGSTPSAKAKTENPPSAAKPAGASATPVHPSSPGSAALPAIMISKLRLQDGTFNYLDKISGAQARLEAMNLNWINFRLDGPSDLRLSFAYHANVSGKPFSGRVDYRGRIDPGQGNLNKMSLEAKPLKIELDELNLEASGSISNLSSPKVDLTFSLPALDAKKLKAFAFIPSWVKAPALQGMVRAQKNGDLFQIQELNVSGDKISLKVSGSYPQPDLKISLSAQLPSIPADELRKMIPNAAPGTSLPPISIQLDGRWHGQRIDLSSSHLSMATLDLTAQGAVVLPGPQGKNPLGLDLAVKTGDTRLADLLAFAPQSSILAPQGTVGLNVRVSGTSAAPVLSGSAHVKSLGLMTSGQKLSDISGTASFSPADIKSDLNGKLNDGVLDIHLSAKNYSGPKPQLRLSGNLSLLDLTKLPSSQNNAPAAAPPAQPQEPPTQTKKSWGPMDVSGNFAVAKIMHPNFSAEQLTLAWDMRGLSSDFSKLNGFAKFRLGAGKFDDLKSLSSGGAAMRILLLPITLLQKVGGLVKISLFPSFDRVTFLELTGDYAFTDGVMQVKESHLNSNTAYVAMSGSANLVKDQLNLRISTKLGSQLGLKLAGPIGITVRGSLSDPKVRPDVAAILKQPGVDQALEQGKKLLQNLFK